MAKVLENKGLRPFFYAHLSLSCRLNLQADSVNSLKITVGYLDMETMNIVDTQMYIDGYQVKLVSDTSKLWELVGGELHFEGVLIDKITPI